MIRRIWQQPRWRLAAVAGVGLLVLYFLFRGSSGPGNGGTFTARRGPLQIAVLEGGSIEALESQEIRSQIKGFQGTKILGIVEEGYLVTEDDVKNGKVLVELDSSDLKTRITTQEIQYQSTLSAFVEANQAYDIQLNQNTSDIKAAEQKARFARMDFEKFLGSKAGKDVIDQLGLYEKPLTNLLDLEALVAQALQQASSADGTNGASGAAERFGWSQGPSEPGAERDLGNGNGRGGPGGSRRGERPEGVSPGPRGRTGGGMDGALAAIELTQGEMPGGTNAGFRRGPRGPGGNRERFGEAGPGGAMDGESGSRPRPRGRPDGAGGGRGGQGEGNFGAGMEDEAGVRARLRNRSSGGDGAQPGLLVGGSSGSAADARATGATRLSLPGLSGLKGSSNLLAGILPSTNGPIVDFMKYATNAAELEDGDAQQKLRAFRDELLIAQQAKKLAEIQYEGTMRLYQSNFAAKTTLDSEELSVKQKQIAESKAGTAEQLFIRYEFVKTAEQYLSLYDEALRGLERARKEAISKMAQARAKMMAAESRFRIESDQLEEFYEQRQKCVIRAERPGLVVYGGGDERRFFGGGDEQIREGAVVRERQPIITIPDMTKMAVKLRIHESHIKKVTRGQKARIRVDAFPDDPLTGQVLKVGVLPDSQSRWMSPDMKLYVTSVAIDGTHEWIKPGMSAKVEILVNELPDVIYVPMQAVMPLRGKQVCFVANGGKPDEREVETGEYNDDFIEIKKGLTEGELVLLRAPQGYELDTEAAAAAVDGTGTRQPQGKSVAPATPSPTDLSVPAGEGGPGRGSRGGGGRRSGGA